MKVIVKVLAVAVATIGLYGCGDFFSSRHDQATPQEKSNPPNGKLTFVDVQTAIFSQDGAGRCVACHAQYASYAGIRRELDSIVSSINFNRMPKSAPPLSSELRELLRAWVEAGAPQFADREPAPAPPDELAPVWSSIYDQVITSRCLACHNPKGQAKFLDLSTRQAIFDARDRDYGVDESGRPIKLVDFEQPGKSYLLTVILDPQEPMPPTWSNIRRLNQNEVDVLTIWIGLGLP